MIYKLIIFITITLFIIFLLKKYVKDTEFFENNGLSANNIASNALNVIDNVPEVEESQEEPVVETLLCPVTNWWDEKPIKAIRSKLWGASYNLVYQPDGNMTTPVLIPINNPNSSAPAGCLSVTQNGWHQSAMCSEKNIDQRWIIKKISSLKEFEKAMGEAKESGGTIGFTYGYKMEKVDYPFFIVVAKDHPSEALYYNGSALGVRPLGNYDDQKWDILQNEVKNPIVTNNFNYYSKLTPEMQLSPSSGDSTLGGGNLSGFQQLSSNPEALAAILQNIMQTPNTNGTFGVTGPLKINIEMDDEIVTKLTGEMANPQSSSNTTVIEPFTNNTNNVYYPKKPMDISVTLNYAIASAPVKKNNNTSNNNSNMELVDINQIDGNGNLVKIGETQMEKNQSVTNEQCNETQCYPNMNEWVKKPYPCVGCVPNETETW